MGEVTLLGPGGATEAKQDAAAVLLALLSRESTQLAIGNLLSAFASVNHTDLTAILTRLGQTLSVDTGLSIPQPQTDALTNAQLRALAVAISAASLPLPAGAATAAKQLPDGHDVRVSNQPAEFPLPAAQIVALAPQTNALTQAQLLEQELPVRTEDSSEREYTPGLLGTLVTAAGDTVVYAPPAGKSWILHQAYAVPVTRGAEEPPVITIKTITSAATGGTPLKTHFVWAANSSRKRITMPADARLVVELDIPGRVPTTFDIEVLP